MFRIVAGGALASVLAVTPMLADRPAAAQAHGGYTHTGSPLAMTAGGEDPVVARVDGSEIRRSDLAIATESLPPQYRQMPMQMLYQPLLNQMIDRRLIANEADKAKLADDPAVKQRLAYQRERVLQEAYLSRELKARVTDERLKALYAKSQGGEREIEVHARHILVPDEAEAKKIAAEAKAGGDFAAMAKAKSKDPGAANGGDLGFFKRDQMVPEFATAAFALKPGEISSPVKSPYGWHVIKVEERRQAPPPSFEESAEELREQAAEEVLGEMLAGLRAKARVETFNLEGKAEPLKPEPQKK